MGSGDQNKFWLVAHDWIKYALRPHPCHMNRYLPDWKLWHLGRKLFTGAFLLTITLAISRLPSSADL